MNIDIKILVSVLEAMTIPQRREWFIKMLMAKNGATFESIAKRHRLNKWYINGTIIGTFPLNKKVVNALEKEFNIDLGPFMTGEEKKKLGRKI